MTKLSKFKLDKIICLSLLLVIFLSACKNPSVKELSKGLQERDLQKQKTEEPKEQITGSNAVGIDYDTTLWKEILPKDSTIILDIRYATENNFTKKQIYDCARCFLRPEVHGALMDFADKILSKHNLGIILYDCYRPRPYQQRLWDIVPDEKFVGNPAKGSMHNRGMAVDIGLIDMDGNILDMGSDFDHFGPESFHSATNISKEALKNRKLLKAEIESFGFKHITSEWWHYSYRENIQELTDWVWNCP